MKPALPFSLAVLAVCAALAAAAPGLDISSQVDKSEITIGDRITYEIKVIYPSGGRVELPSVLGNLGTFEVKEYQASEPMPTGKQVLQTWRFNLSTFTVGKYVIPPQQVILIMDSAADSAAEDRPSQAGGGDSAVFFTQPIEINVVRTSPETVQDIADIAGPAEMEKSFPWLAYLLGLMLAGALGMLIWRWRKRLAPRKTEQPLLPPFEEALEKMKTLRPAESVRANRAREYCFAVSEVLRRYVTRRFEIDALDATTTEFLERAHPLPLTSAHKQWLAAFCEATDLVKFATGAMLESDAEQWHGQLLEFLRQTKPREEPAAAGAEAKGPRDNVPAGKPGAQITKGKPGPVPSAASGVVQSRSPGPGAPRQEGGT